MGIRIGFGNIIIGSGSGWGGNSIPSPDALFDSRSGLNLQDSIGGQIATIGGFPMLYPEARLEATFAYYNLTISPSVDLATWTQVILARRVTGVDSRPFLGGRNTLILIRTASPAMQMNNPNQTQTQASQDWTTWHLIGYYLDTTDGNKIGCLWNNNFGTQTVSTSPYTSHSTQTIRFTDSYSKCYVRGFAMFNKRLSNAEIANIRTNCVYPTDGSLVVNVQCSNPDTPYIMLDGVKRYTGSWTDNGVTATRPGTPWIYRDDHITGAYNLIYGYTRQGSYTIPYLPTKLKGDHTHVDDIEYPTENCLHNMVESRINFSGISDATIKAIFDKSNRTYWNASIETTAHYIDAGGGYYGLWHPSELLTTFIDTHAQPGHNGHILASLRTSGAVVTGITAIRVYKTSL